jgi:hypothetical protein
MELERAADEKRRAEEMAELKKGASASAGLGSGSGRSRGRAPTYGREPTYALGQAQHLGALSKLKRGALSKLDGTIAYDGRVLCSTSVCHTCVRVAEETRVVVQCGEDQEILDFADVVWGAAAEQPSWEFDDLPAKCGVDVTDITTRRMTVAAERVQLLESLKALCSGKESCDIDASRALLGDCEAGDLAAGRCVPGSLALSLIARCGSITQAIVEKNEAIVDNMDNTKQCKNGCKSCMTVAHYELDTMFECDEGMVMTGFVDAVYGDSAVLPQFEFDNHPGMCFQSMIPTGDACRADKQDVLDVLHRQCAGQSRQGGY